MADGKSIFSDNTYTWKNSVKDSCIAFQLIQKGSNDNKFEGMVAQQLQFGIQRQPRMVFEIGSTNYYAIDSRPQGSGSLSNIFGPSDAALKALTVLGDICKPSEFKITIKSCMCGNGGRDQAKSKTILFTGGFLAGVQLSARAEDPTAQGSWTFIFQDLLVDD